MTANLFQTVVHIGCANATGKTTVEETTDATYAEFTDLEVRRVSDNVQMTYWGNPQNFATDTPELLARSDGNGNCQAWGALLRDCFRAQGIPSDRIWLSPVSANDQGILVKNWQFVEPPSGIGLHPYRLGVDAMNLMGIPGQGNAEPPAAFNGHCITEADGYYFDPSYGTPKIGGSNKEKLYEDSSIDGFEDGTGQWCRKNNVFMVSNSEMQYAPCN